MNRDTIIEKCGKDAIVLEPEFLDNAIIGTTTDGRVVYDYYLLADAFVKYDNMSYEDAIEWIEFNTLRSLPYMGEKRPEVIFLETEE